MDRILDMGSVDFSLLPGHQPAQQAWGKPRTLNWQGKDEGIGEGNCPPPLSHRLRIVFSPWRLLFRLYEPLISGQKVRNLVFLRVCARMTWDLRSWG